MARPDYPFTPKSNRWLEPGQFWAIPLDDGRFACGRVLSVRTQGVGGRTAFRAGLMDWSADEPPVADSLIGRAVIAQNNAHVLTITQTGGEVLGFRPLDVDEIVPAPDTGGAWAVNTIKRLAEHHFGSDR